ncbi:hypothetical protein ACFPIJ_26120 [Dactylosporangium cerinum]|uniref:Lipoprotein n=1 Tax=Dactylosporangium cerinum TaxID=1434730 RepID=A0ABV9VYX1_9ACTN
MGDRLMHARRVGAAVVAAITMVMVGAGCGDTKGKEVVYRDVAKVLDHSNTKLPAAGDPAPSLAGPHFEIRLAGRQIGTRSREFAFFMGDHAATGVAAEGFELALIRLGSSGIGTNPGQVICRVSAGATVLQVPTPSGSGFDTLFAMVVPVGAPLTLTVTDEGRAQSLDLRTGALGPDAAVEFQQSTAQPLSGSTTVTGTVTAFGQSRPYTIVLTPITVSRIIYDPAMHWAPAGRAWLRISMRFTSNSLYVDGQRIRMPFYLLQSLDLPTALVFTLPDGTRVPAMAGTYEQDPVFAPKEPLLHGSFEVPAGTRVGTVTVALGGTVTATPGGSGDGRPDRTQRVRYAPTPATVSVAVALPA